MNILHVEKALAPNRYEQEEIYGAMIEKWDGARLNQARLDRLQRSIQVKSRHLALPLDAYPKSQHGTIRTRQEKLILRDPASFRDGRIRA